MSDLFYVSTRGAAPPVTLSEAIVRGLAADGGLYVPNRLPTVDLAALTPLSSLAGARTHGTARLLRGRPPAAHAR